MPPPARSQFNVLVIFSVAAVSPRLWRPLCDPLNQFPSFMLPQSGELPDQLFGYSRSPSFSASRLPLA